MAIFRKGNALRYLKGQNYSSIGSGGGLLEKSIALLGFSPKSTTAYYPVSVSNLIPIGRQLYGLANLDNSSSSRLCGFNFSTSGSFNSNGMVGYYSCFSSPPTSRLSIKLIKGDGDFYWLSGIDRFGKRGIDNPVFYADGAYKIFSTTLNGSGGVYVKDAFYDKVDQKLYALYNNGIVKYNKAMTSVEAAMYSATTVQGSNIIKIGDYIYTIGYLNSGGNVTIQKFNTSLVLQATKQFNIVQADYYKRVTTDGTYLYFLQRGSSLVDSLLKIDSSLNIIAERTINHGAEYAGSYPTYSRGLEWTGSSLVYCYKVNSGLVRFATFDSDLNKISEVTSNVSLGTEPSVFSLYYDSDEELFTYSATENAQTPTEVNFYVFNKNIEGEWVETSTGCTITTTTTWSISTNAITFSPTTASLSIGTTLSSGSAGITSCDTYLSYTDSNQNLNNLI